MLIEPTETESVETLDAFADALIAIAAEAETDPGAGHRAPRTTRRSGASTRPTAARQPNLRWRPMTGAETPCPGLKSRSARAVRTLVRLEVDSPRGAVDSTGSAPT